MILPTHESLKYHVSLFNVCQQMTDVKLFVKSLNSVQKN